MPSNYAFLRGRGLSLAKARHTVKAIASLKNRTSDETARARCFFGSRTLDELYGEKKRRADITSSHHNLDKTTWVCKPMKTNSAWTEPNRDGSRLVRHFAMIALVLSPLLQKASPNRCTRRETRPRKPDLNIIQSDDDKPHREGKRQCWHRTVGRCAYQSRAKYGWFCRFVGGPGRIKNMLIRVGSFC